jgi:hypothetical protein
MNGLFIFLTIAGYIIGLGAVTVIDLHGFFGRTSAYWTEATTRTHKITKPLIWIGTMLALGAGLFWYYSVGFLDVAKLHALVFTILIANGVFLSFSVSPFLLERERQGKQAELLPSSWQKKITASFLVSFAGWWGSLVLFVISITKII